jgi:hypothetical protein
MRANADRRTAVARLRAVALWVVLLAAALTLPRSADGPTRRTADLAVVGYGIAAASLLRLSGGDWSAATSRGRWARNWWTLACATFLVHVGVAYGGIHHWSHAAAYRHVEAVSGFGQGAYVSDLFAVVWAADVFAWWLRPCGYAARPSWVGRGLHGFMAFIVFNGAVIYESGPIRWAALAAAVVLAILWLRR